MKEIDFDKFNKRQKADVVWEWGYYLGTRKSTTHTIALFLINDFFCEVYINLSDNKTDDIKTVACADLHSDFMSSLDLSNPLIKTALEKNPRAQKA